MKKDYKLYILNGKMLINPVKMFREKKHDVFSNSNKYYI